jgi:thiol-disulfide isomerase/thioredoxin
MIWIFMAAASAADLPTAQLSWKNEQVMLEVDAPVGFKVGQDVPVNLSLSWNDKTWSLSGLGEDLARRVALPDVRGHDVIGDFLVPICDLEGTTCVMMDLALAGRVDKSKKGMVDLLVSPQPQPTAEPDHDLASLFQTDAQQVADEAFSAAQKDGRRVLLDFSAVWCPPCNQLAIEVLHAETPAPVLDEVVVAVLDVDDPSSWRLKDRYSVGGYPTLVVVEADGTEVGRIGGYPGREAFVEWLSDTLKLDSPVDYASMDVEALTPAEALAAAEQIALVDGDYQAFLKRAELDAGNIDMRIFRMGDGANADDASWLLVHAPERALEWAPWGIDSENEALAQSCRDGIRRALPHASGFEAADLLYYAAQGAPEPDRAFIYASGAAALGAALSGDLTLDRPHVTFQASLMAKSGDVDGALNRLDEARELWPGEPTWDLKATNLLIAADRPVEAITHADRALQVAWGDNHLRVAEARVRALEASGQVAKARAFASKILDEVPAPSEDVAVRSHRYRDALSKHLEEQ